VDKTDRRETDRPGLPTPWRVLDPAKVGVRTREGIRLQRERFAENLLNYHHVVVGVGIKARCPRRSAPDHVFDPAICSPSLQPQP
jgi:hypothetical protein